MGLFGDDVDYRTKETADWNGAERAEHSISGKRGFVMISDRTQIIVPREPWKQYQEEDTVSEWHMLYYCNMWGEVIGHTEYAHAIEKLEEYALDSDRDSLLIRRLEEEELYSLVEVWPKREDYFTYVEELSLIHI